MRRLGAAAASAAVLLIGGVGGAYAADLSAMPVKAVPVAGPTSCVSILDFFTTACQVAAYGVRFYGTVDVGFGYQTNSAPIDKYAGTNYFLGKPNQGAKFTLAPNALSPSNIGFQIKEGIGGGWSFVGQVEAGFQPFSMDLLNGVHSQFYEVGRPISQQTAIGDSNSQGQFYNDLGFAGFSHDTWGTLTFMRQNNLLQDQAIAYDPMGMGASVSPLGFFGTYAGGGDTQNRRDTTAIKYRVNLANWHFGAYGQVGGYDEGNASRGAYSGNIGADFNVGPGVFSADVTGVYRKDAVSLGSQLVGSVDANGYPTNVNSGFVTSGANAGNYSQFMQATISNNTTVMATAKYSVDRLKLYAGYEWIQFQNPSDSVSSFTDIAGDYLCAGCQIKPGTKGAGQLFNGTNISNTAYNVAQIRQLAWFGGRYSVTDSLDVAAAYYHIWQNNYASGANVALCAASNTGASSCAGTIDAVSALVDWKFAPKWDTYLATLYSRNTGGLDSGYLARDSWATTAGLRFRW